MKAPWSREEFEARLRAEGSAYHIHHPYNVMLNTGAADPAQIRGWVANRFYYQISIPIKDAAILANCPDRAVRRNWVQRILDHDGHGDDPGGIESWLRLAEAVGLSRESVESLSLVLPGVRFAVDAYVNFARRAPWQEAVCSSLTELFAPEIHKQRLARWPEHYPWIDPQGLHYFQSRVSLARRDVEFGLDFTLRHFDSRPLQERAIEILKFKLDVLWQMSDAMALRYMVPPGERAPSRERAPVSERASSGGRASVSEGVAPDDPMPTSELALPGERVPSWERAPVSERASPDERASSGGRASVSKGAAPDDPMPTSELALPGERVPPTKRVPPGGRA